ncbi:hypothetical protein [Nocardia cyriacigeorgica]|nr:hypothetical protein [Nocardia cyriacigeorgica]
MKKYGPGVEVRWNYSTDPNGNPLALVIFPNRRFEYIPHDEFKAA